MNVCRALFLGFGLSLAVASSAHAQAQAKFSFEGVADCDRPIVVKNFPIRGDGTGTLSADRSANLEFDSNVEGRINYNVKLGGGAVEAANGSASLSVLGRKSLRAVRDYPNNLTIIDLKIGRDNRCSLSVTNRLKPGKKEYTFNTAIGLAYCNKPTITKATCSAY